MSPFFRSFEANSYSYSTKMIGEMGQNGFSAVGSLFSDRLLVVLCRTARTQSWMRWFVPFGWAFKRFSPRMASIPKMQEQFSIICGLICNRHRTTRELLLHSSTTIHPCIHMTHKNKTTSNHLMAHWSINTKLTEHSFT